MLLAKLRSDGMFSAALFVGWDNCCRLKHSWQNYNIRLEYTVGEDIFDRFITALSHTHTHTLVQKKRGEKRSVSEQFNGRSMQGRFSPVTFGFRLDGKISFATRFYGLSVFFITNSFKFCKNCETHVKLQNVKHFAVLEYTTKQCQLMSTRKKIIFFFQ